VHTRPLKWICAVLTGVWMALASSPAHAADNPAITSIAVDSKACANVCFVVSVDNPAPGTITLRLTGHTPSGGSEWVDIGAPHVVLDIVSGTPSYRACFGDVSQLIAGKGFNSLRVDVVSSTVPGLTGTTTKSDSFSCTGGSGGSGGGSGGSGGSGSSGGGSSTTGGGTSTAALANTGGFDYRFPLIGLPVLASGLLLLVLTASGRRLSRR
jgi:uncharacterized membrane protein YgcG